MKETTIIINERRVPLLQKTSLPSGIDRLGKLPEEILISIDSFLSAKDSRALRLTSKRLSGNQGKLVLTNCFFRTRRKLTKYDDLLCEYADSCLMQASLILTLCPLLPLTGIICHTLRVPSAIIICLLYAPFDVLRYVKSNANAEDIAYVNYPHRY